MSSMLFCNLEKSVKKIDHQSKKEVDMSNMKIYHKTDR